ncbi:type II secretion system F family protein [Anaerosporobacter faecicola]|uniref:type II secretion system F family protein n=1 Tax=Anaerosporobacter faecicola TaxID=2718714 RepID=UPI001439AD62|nr:type II secretion system F family protein [Anaerosporobacter faecicola]
MGWKEAKVVYAKGAIIFGFLLWIFYRNGIVLLLGSPLLLLYKKQQEKKRCKERKWELTLQFKEGLQSLVAALSAGYSIENAFRQALQDLKLLYGEDTMIHQEFSYIVYQIRMNIPVEQALEDFAKRSDIDDIKSLAEVFRTAKKSGGNLIQILRTTNQIIGDKIEVSREITTMMSAKKFEANIMTKIPLAIILYMDLSSPGFLDPLYHNLLGGFIMTGALGIYLFSYVLMNRILSIEV